MGGLDGNARVHLTQDMATERRRSVGLSKEEMAEAVERTQQS